MEASADAPRPTPALVADRTFGPYFAGNLASNIGTWCQQITAAVVVFNVTGSTFMVGLVGVSQFLPSLVLAPWTGVAADRFDRRRLLLRAQALAALAAGVLALLTLTMGLDRFPAAWPVLAATLVIGLCNAVSTPAQQALVPALVPPIDLDGALALNSVSYNLARAVGPAIGAAVLVAWGAGWAFGLNAVSYLIFVGALILVSVPSIPKPVGRQSIWTGLRQLRTDPTLAVLLIGITALGFGIDPVLTLTPAIAQTLQDSTFDNPDALVGLLISSFGAGAVLGTLIVARVRIRWGHLPVAASGLGFVAVGALGLAFSPVAWMALAFMVLGGVGFLFGVTSLTSAMHVRIPEEIRGRIMALWGVAFLGSRPVAAFVDGAVADLVSPQVATIVSTSVVVVCLMVLIRLIRSGEPSPGGTATTTAPQL